VIPLASVSHWTVPHLHVAYGSGLGFVEDEELAAFLKLVPQEVEAKTIRFVLEIEVEAPERDAASKSQMAAAAHALHHRTPSVIRCLFVVSKSLTPSASLR
jgi:hypothetical protein